jgi:porin
MRACLLLLITASCLPAFGQGADSPSDSQAQKQPRSLMTVRKQEPDDLKQELDVDALALSKIPSDPLLKADPFAPFLQPIGKLTDELVKNYRLKFGATYTFLNQYATITPDEARHNQLSGRLDFTGAWAAYDNGSTAGSISLLVRSGTNIGISHTYNLNDRLGSGLYLNCLQGGGPQMPVTLNILYWRQDFLQKRLSFYIGKIHPNQYISLSMFNNDERTQFLNGQNDGNLAFAYEGAYAGGTAMEFQATRHLYIHALAVDTEGSANRNINTLVDRKYMEAFEIGWFTGSPGNIFRDYRIGFWRDDTKTLGSGFGGGVAFEHEFANGWAPFGRYAFASKHGSTVKQTDTIGLDQVHPFGRRGDMFGIAFNYTMPNRGGLHHESVFETFYRLRLTQSLDLGPDVEVSVHPTYAVKSYTTTLISMRMRVIF